MGLEMKSRRITTSKWPYKLEEEALAMAVIAQQLQDSWRVFNCDLSFDQFKVMFFDQIKKHILNGEYTLDEFDSGLDHVVKTSQYSPNGTPFVYRQLYDSIMKSRRERLLRQYKDLVIALNFSDGWTSVIEDDRLYTIAIKMSLKRKFDACNKNHKCEESVIDEFLNYLYMIENGEIRIYSDPRKEDRRPKEIENKMSREKFGQLREEARKKLGVVL